MSHSLVALVNEASNIELMLIQSEGQLTPEIEAALAVSEIQLPEKVDNYDMILSRFEHLEDYYKTRAQFFAQIQKQCAALQTRLKENIKFAMQENNIDELKGNDIRFKLSPSKSALSIYDEAMVPRDYKKEVITVEVDKKRLSEDLSIGEIPGAKLVPSVSLRKYANSPAKKAGK